MGNFDLDSLRNLAQEELDQQENKNQNGVPLVYPGKKGTIRVKLLANYKGGILQRRIFRHNIGKEKIPCFKQYGQDCPICKAINDTEAVSKDSAWRKYGAKPRGICYAQLIDYDKLYEADENTPARGSLVLLMYPQTIYTEINRFISEAGENLEKLIDVNDGFTIEITNNGANSNPRYSTKIYPYGTTKSFETSVVDGKTVTGEEKFEDFMTNEVPNLLDAIVPKDLTEEMIEKAKAAAEAITEEYFGENAVLNPEESEEHQTHNNNKRDAEETTIADIASDPEQESSSEQSDNKKPECFGSYSDGDKCMVCPFETDCIVETE